MKANKIIVAPNAFKGALSAKDAARAISRGLIAGGFKGELIQIPIADGGDGSLEVVAGYLDLQIKRSKVFGPLGRPVMATWGLNKSKGLAVIEMAEASGLRLLAPDELNPLRATSFGTGQLLMEAVSSGATEIYLTVGGSATVDLGIGILEAMGLKLYTRKQPIRGVTPNDFLNLTKIDLSTLKDINHKFNISILSDVSNPLLGSDGAATVFGPQKGADTKMVDQLEQALSHMADLLENATRKSLRDLRGGGAAGGVTAGLHVALDAEIIDGAEQILIWAHFDECLKDTDLLITGEGKIDVQTNFGKGPGLVAKKAKEMGIRVIGLSGILDDDTSKIQHFDQLIAISNPDELLKTSMQHTAINLEKAAIRISDS